MFFKNIIKFLARNEIQQSYMDGFHKKEEMIQKQKDEIHETLSKFYMGKPVIAVPNEWENPQIGRVVGYTPDRFLVIYDYIKQEETIVFGSSVFFSMERMELILNMNPFERWAIVSKMEFVRKFESSFIMNKDIMSKEQIIETLTKNGFFDYFQTILDNPNIY